MMGAEICCEINDICYRKRRYLLYFLTGLRLDDGWYLDRTFPKDDNFSGELSRLFAANDKGEVEYIKEHYLRRFRIISEDGFWQIYLLYNAISVMPAYWHGLYLMRGYIFTLSDIKYIENMKESDKAIFSKQKQLLPELKIKKNSATIIVTYWSDRKGLCRETVEINIDDDCRMTSIKTTKEEILVPNHIHIRY